VQHELLESDLFGANGIAYRKRSLWVLNWGEGRIVRIPIERDGSPGPPKTFVESDLLVGADGGQFDILGNMYIGVFPAGYLARVSRRGEVEIFMTAEQLAPFGYPINPVFGFGRDRKTLYMTRWWDAPGTEFDGVEGDVVKVNVGVPGMLLPQFTQRRDQ
jgi:sugar lactone lactonase YvrE